LLLITDAPPKFHRHEVPATVNDTIDELVAVQISQLHMLVRERDYDRDYRKFHHRLKGKYFDLERVRGSDAFARLLPDIGEEISKTTIASRPSAPAGAAPPPSLPAEGGAPLPPAPRARALQAVQSTQAFALRDRYRLLLAIAAWTMAIAVCISLLILSGQHFYTRQAWAGLPEAGRALLGGVAAGLVGGTAGQLFFQATSGGLVWEVVSRVLGWSLLGGLIGGGLALVVPNLKGRRGLLGGTVGGFLGALGFLLVSLILGPFLGRWVGATILGFCIGLMVALAEQVFRRYWLEIAFGPREVRTVTLGAAAVSIGGDERRALVYVPGAPAITLRYRVEGDRVLCDDVLAERTVEALPGECREVGRVLVTLCSAAQARQTGYAFRLSNGRTLALTEGMPLTAEDLSGLEPQGADGAVALVSRRPNDPQTLVLRNRSRQTWAARAADGGRQAVGPGQGLELRADLQVEFGQVRGILLRAGRATS
jgi:hypothetical protein